MNAGISPFSYRCLAASFSVKLSSPMINCRLTRMETASRENVLYP